MKWSKLLPIIASHSKCTRSKVGAVIHKDGRIISTGWNGMPSGLSNCCEDTHNVTNAEVIHAEANAILFAAKLGISTDGASLSVTMSPCVDCAKLIIQSGIQEVQYCTLYRDTAGLDLLKKVGISVKELL